jgi:hypothetical protein
MIATGAIKNIESAWKLGVANLGKPIHGAAASFVQKIQQVSADGSEDDRQSAPNSARRDRNQPDDQNCYQSNRGVELAATHGLDGHWREIETNHRDHRTCYDRGH